MTLYSLYSLYYLYLSVENPGKTVGNLAVNTNNTGNNVSILALSGTVLLIPRQIRTHEQFFMVLELELRHTVTQNQDL